MMKNNSPLNYFSKAFREQYMPEYLNTAVLDIVNVFSQIYIKDISTRRGSSWERTIKVDVGVNFINDWNKNKDLLKRLIAFVSEDILDISFHYTNHDIQPMNTKLIELPANKFITLLSGGLDSFCGVQNNILKEIPSDYVSYRTSNYEVHAQKQLHNFLSNINKNNNSIFFPKLSMNKIEYTQRTRSLLFLSLGLLVASYKNINEVRIYENGILSLNPSFIRRHTTKSTHPKTLFLFNKLLRSFDIPITITNPFMFKTKGAILKDLSSQFKDLIKETTSCGTSRQVKYLHKEQCGHCIPCILRKISINSQELKKFDREYLVGYDTKYSSICNKQYAANYRSSIEYFKTYSEKIKSNTIWPYLDIHSKYFNTTNYYEKLKNMFDEFSNEVERFLMENELY